jgi:hypothetical protein
VLPEQLKYSTPSSCIRSVIVCITDGCLEIPITLFFSTCIIYIPQHLPVSSSLSAAPCSTLSSLASSTGSSAEQKPVLCERNLLHITTFDYLTIHFNIIIIFNVEIIFFDWCCCLILQGRKTLLSPYDKLPSRHLLQTVTSLSLPWDDQLSTGNLHWTTWIRTALPRNRSWQLCRSMETLVCSNTARCINSLMPSGHFTYCRV